MDNSCTYTSPYTRTRETLNIFKEHLKLPLIKEDIRLVEQQYGLFDSIPNKEWPIVYPNVYSYFTRLIENKCRFWARLPLGESSFDVALRIDAFLNSLKEDEVMHKVNTVFIFTHDIASRVFAMRYLQETVEWFEDEPTPGNCWIRLLENKQDKGYIYKG